VHIEFLRHLRYERLYEIERKLVLADGAGRRDERRLDLDE
jgi:hypothetical protein